MRSFVLSIVLFLMLPLALRAQSGEDSNHCDGVLALVGRNISVTARQYAFADMSHKDLCQGKTLKTGFSASASVTAMVESLPVPLTGSLGSTKDRAQHMCETFDSWKEAQGSSVDLQINAAEPAIRAWGECQRLASNKVFIDVQGGVQSILISVRRGTENAEFTGLRTSGAVIDCTGPVKSWGGFSSATVPVTKDTRYSLDTAEEFQITCVRAASSTPDGGHYFEAGEIAVSTSRGGLVLPIPRDERYSPAFASEVQRELADLKTTSSSIRDDLSARIDSIGGRTIDQSDQGAWSGEGGRKWVACPPGHYVASVGGWDTDGGRYCSTCVSRVGIKCLPLPAAKK